MLSLHMLVLGIQWLVMYLQLMEGRSCPSNLVPTELLVEPPHCCIVMGSSLYGWALSEVKSCENVTLMSWTV